MDLMPSLRNSLMVVAMLALLGRDMASRLSVTQWLQEEHYYCKTVHCMHLLWAYCRLSFKFLALALRRVTQIIEHTD